MTTRFVETYGPISDKSVGTLVKGFDGGIMLYQRKTYRTRTYSVQYGKQLDEMLTYAEACMMLGQAMLHHLACEGLIDNERD